MDPGPSYPPSSYPKRSGTKATHKVKKTNKQSSIDDPSFAQGYRAAYATIYDRNDYAAAIEQLKSLGHDDRITGLGRRAMALACDVVQCAGVEECVAETHRRFGRLDVAITTVGWHLFSRFLDMPDRDVDYMINAELRSVIRLARAILPIMADQKGGRA